MKLAELNAFRVKIRKLEATPQEIKDKWVEFKASQNAITAELKQLQKKQLLRMCGYGCSTAFRKDRLVSIALKNMMQSFAPGDTFTYEPHNQTVEQAVDEQVETWTDELIAALKNPKPQPAYTPPPPSPKELQRREEEAKGEEWLKLHKPSWAEAVIVAELHRDTSDTLSDYHGSEVEKFVVLAWSKHTRDLFSEMRQAADRYPETQHLGTDKGIFRIYKNPNPDYPDERNRRLFEYNGKDWWPTLEEAEAVAQEVERRDAEHIAKRKAGVIDHSYVTQLPFGYFIKGSEDKIENREKYAMGHGYYLGHDRYRGWQVFKRQFSSGMAEVAAAIGRGDHILEVNPPQQAQRSSKRSTSPVQPKDIKPLTLPEGVELTIIESQHTQTKEKLWCVKISQKVERSLYNELNNRAKQLGGYYSSFRRDGAIPGFLFKEEAKAKLFIS
jgi:hypothetical protein